MHFLKKISLFIIALVLFTNFILIAQSRIDLIDINIPGSDDWDSTKNYSSGSIVKKGEFDGTPMYWSSLWWAGKGEEPGGKPDSGGSSPWTLVNSKAFGEGKAYEWVGWNDSADKVEHTHDNEWVFTTKKIGTWGPQIQSKGPGAYLPTYRDGAEGIYTIIHEGLGKLDFNYAIQTANEVGYDHARIRTGWGANVSEMSDDEWLKARQMLLDGHEILNNSYNGLPVGEVWKWFFHGDTLDNQDPLIPNAIKNLVVDSVASSWQDLEIQIPEISFINGDVTKPETTYNIAIYQVSDYNYLEDSTFNAQLGEYEYEYISTGKIKAGHKGWSDAASANVSMLKIKCMEAWTATAYKANIKEANDLINENVYNQVASPRFKKNKKSEYFVYPLTGGFSVADHDSLKNYGLIGACGGAASGTPMPGDFFYPYWIDYDEFFLMNSEGSKVFPDNPYQRLSLDGMLDVIYKTKGYMVRKFSGVYDNTWENFLEVNHPRGSIPKSLYKSHFEKIDQMIDEHKIAVVTPSEALCYRLTANSVSSVYLEDNGWGNAVLTVEASGCPPEYQDEISVIVKLNDFWPCMSARYKDGDYPRYQPRKLDQEGRAWSVYLNPYEQEGVVNLEIQMPGIFGNLVNLSQVPILKNINKSCLSLNLPSGNYSFKLYDFKGKAILKKSIISYGKINTVKFNKELATGSYVVNISDGVNAIKRKILIK